jgi:DNA-binding NtrC family response regulator
VIIITGYADLDGAVLALRHGAADYILKPINLDVLRSGIKRILEKNLAARRLQEAQQQLLQAERLAAIGRTVASISHESRNELNTLGLGANP